MIFIIYGVSRLFLLCIYDSELEYRFDYWNYNSDCTQRARKREREGIERGERERGGGEGGREREREGIQREKIEMRNATGTCRRCVVEKKKITSTKPTPVLSLILPNGCHHYLPLKLWQIHLEHPIYRMKRKI